MTLLPLFLLALSLTGAADTDDLGVARDALAVSLEGEPLLEDRGQTADLLVVWVIRESAGQADAIGDCDDPKHRTIATCRSFGAMQMSRRWLEGRIDAVLADRRLSMRLGLHLMHHLAKKCGSVRGGLLAYSSGSCLGTPRARDLVTHRCKLAGVVC